MGSQNSANKNVIDLKTQGRSFDNFCKGPKISCSEVDFSFSLYRLVTSKNDHLIIKIIQKVQRQHLILSDVDPTQLVIQKIVDLEANFDVGSKVSKNRNSARPTVVPRILTWRKQRAAQ